MSHSKHPEHEPLGHDELQNALYQVLIDFRADKIHTPSGLQLLKTFVFRRIKNHGREDKEEVFSYMLTAIYNGKVEPTPYNTFAYIRHRMFNALEETGLYIPDKKPLEQDPDAPVLDKTESRYRAGRQIKPIPVDMNMYAEQAVYSDEKARKSSEFRADWHRQLGRTSINWTNRNELFK